MSAKTWTDIPSADLDAESPVTEDLLGDFHSNQESLITSLADCRYAQRDGFPAAWTLEVYVPEAVATTDGTVELVVRFEAWIDSGTTATVKMKLGSGTNVVTGTISNTVAQAFELRISDTDVVAVAGTNAVLTIEHTLISGGGQCHSKNEWGSSRFERQV